MWARRSGLTYPALPRVVILVVRMVYRVLPKRKMNKYLEGQTSPCDVRERSGPADCRLALRRSWPGAQRQRSGQ